MKLITIMRHPVSGHFLLKSTGMDNNCDIIIGTALKRMDNMIRQDQCHFVGLKNNLLLVVQCTRHPGMTYKNHKVWRDDILTFYRKTMYIAHYHYF